MKRSAWSDWDRWYGKADLLRLIQVSPVEGFLSADVDKRMLEEAAKEGNCLHSPAAFEKEATHLSRLSRYAQGEGPRYRSYRDARSLARAANDAAAGGQAYDMYCQSHSARYRREGQAMLAAAPLRHKRVVQIGTQRRAVLRIYRSARSFTKGQVGENRKPSILVLYRMRRL